MKINHKVYFISGIDTDAGKSYATGYFAKMLLDDGVNVVTQKFVQTGCSESCELSEDIAVHRKIMGVEPMAQDRDYTTCPVMLRYPASADLAARLENTTIDLNLIKRSTATLSEGFDVVLIEGAGGLHVPLKGLYTTLDYIEQEKLPLILVTNAKLGSVNHTFLSLEVARRRNIEVSYVLYNAVPENTEIITSDTRATIERYLSEYHPNCKIINIPKIEL